MNECGYIFCGNKEARERRLVSFWASEISCQTCGKYIVFDEVSYDSNMLGCFGSFLFYRRHLEGKCDTAVIGPSDKFLEDRQGDGMAYFKLDDKIVEAFLPRDFTERIDLILRCLTHQSRYLGDVVNLDQSALGRLFFLGNRSAGADSTDYEQDFTNQVKYICDYLTDRNYVLQAGDSFHLQVAPAGWARVDELQKNLNAKSKTAFVAMKFCDDTKPLREAIKAGIINAGFKPIVMDELEHNNQIVPEMLYQIKQARFLVVDESDCNLGAYYEAGYAAGMGKPVIHICNKTRFNDAAHFDVRQVNTIMWTSDNIDDLSRRLAKRIEATVGNIHQGHIHHQNGL